MIQPQTSHNQSEIDIVLALSSKVHSPQFAASASLAEQREDQLLCNSPNQTPQVVGVRFHHLHHHNKS